MQNQPFIFGVLLSRDASLFSNLVSLVVLCETLNKRCVSTLASLESLAKNVRSDKLASELQDFLLVDKYKTKTGETLTDFDKAILDMKRPENHESKVKLALLLKIMEKDPNLSTIQRVGITKKSNALFTETAKQVTKAKTPTNTASKSSSWWEDKQ